MFAVKPVKVAAGLALSLVCAALAVAAWLLVNDRDVSTSWFDRVETCRPLGGEEASALEERRTYDCIQRVIFDAVSLDDVAAAAAQITSTAAVDNNFYAVCHIAMHTLGRDLIEFYGSAEAAILKVNTIDCGNGLAHGVLDAWAAEDSTLAGSFPSMVAACERASLISNGGCAEGVGHAAFQHQDPVPDRKSSAFKLCELFTTRDLAFACAYGAIMQPYFKQNPEVISEPAEDFPQGDGLVSLCGVQELRDPVRQGCYAGAGWMMGLELTVDEDSFPSAGSPGFVSELSRRLSFCASSPSSIERTLCEDFLLARLPVAWYRPVSELAGRCDKLNALLDADFLPRCLAGAYEFTSPQDMLTLVREYPQIADLIKPRWERERGPFPL